jgi:hypothetical protein
MEFEKQWDQMKGSCAYSDIQSTLIRMVAVYTYYKQGGEVLRYPVHKWLLFLNQCRKRFLLPA